jgi:hypothetical protein
MRDIPTSPRIIEIKRRNRALRIKLGILFIFLFIGIVWLLSFLSGVKNITINEITITGTHIVDQLEIEEVVRRNISGKYLYIFPKANSIIYPHNKILKDLEKSFPRIKTLSLYIDNLDTLRVEIVERKGEYLYCGIIVPENKNDIGENCYFINNDGFIFDKAPYFSGNVFFKYYVSLDGVTDPMGKQILPVENFYKIVRFVDAVSSLGFRPIYLEMDSESGTNYLYLNHSSNGTKPKIIFKNDDDLSIIEENITIAMKKKEFADEINSKYNALQYIDLRFKNKVLYKFQ